MLQSTLDPLELTNARPYSQSTFPAKLNCNEAKRFISRWYKSKLSPGEYVRRKCGKDRL